MNSEQEKRDLMFRLWDQAKRYQNLIDRGRKRLKRFGIKRHIFICRFYRIRTRLARYEEMRLMYVSMAVSLSRKIKLEQRKRRLDH